MNDLEKLARKYGTDKRTNDVNQNIYHGYTDIYYKLFETNKNNIKSILEIGVREGYSHLMWHDYFPNAIIYGIDNFSDLVFENKKDNLREKVLNNLNSFERINIFVGNQEDKNFLNKCFEDINFDIVIDDGSHRSWHQQKTFRYLFPKVKQNGLYIIEDLGVCQLREFREYEDIRSSTLVFLKLLSDKENVFSYYIPDEELKELQKQIKDIYLIGELGVIVKNDYKFINW